MSRNHARASLLVAVLLASPALAGCLGNAQATAMEQKSTADARADAWAEDPRLIEAIGVEGPFASALAAFAGDADAEHWDRASDDPDKGDGHAEVWVYRYIGEDQHDTVLEVVVDKDGEIIATNREQRDADDDPIGEFSVDSDEAAEAAREANEGLREGTDAEHYGIAMVLTDDGDHNNPVWVVVGGGAGSAGGGGGMVVVDAVTGEVVASHGGWASDGGWGWGSHGR